MAKYKKVNGLYHINGQTFKNLIGQRAQVWHGTAYKTSGDLKKKDLYQNKHGRIVSRKKHETAKKEKRLLKHGYGTRKGKFGAIKITPRTSSKKSSNKKSKRRRHTRG